VTKETQVHQVLLGRPDFKADKELTALQAEMASLDLLATKERPEHKVLMVGPDLPVHLGHTERTALWVLLDLQALLGVHLDPKASLERLVLSVFWDHQDLKVNLEREVGLVVLESMAGPEQQDLAAMLAHLAQMVQLVCQDSKVRRVFLDHLVILPLAHLDHLDQLAHPRQVHPASLVLQVHVDIQGKPGMMVLVAGKEHLDSLGSLDLLVLQVLSETQILEASDLAISN
jgi:hypothetical protein